MSIFLFWQNSLDILPSLTMYNKENWITCENMHYSICIFREICDHFFHRECISRISLITFTIRIFTYSLLFLGKFRCQRFVINIFRIFQCLKLHFFPNFVNFNLVVSWLFVNSFYLCYHIQYVIWTFRS